MSGTRTVLVVSHEATRTGAPKVAEHLMRELRADAGWRTVGVHRWGGPMAAELDAAADETFLEPAAALRVTLRRWRRSKRAAGSIERWAIERTLRRVRPDVVWCNTVITGVYAKAAVRAGIPVVVHSHESGDLVRIALERSGLRDVATASSVHLVGCASDTAATLAEELGVPADAVAVLHSPVDVAAVRAAGERAENPFGDDDRPVVVACGVGNGRKGVDTFSAAASIASDRARWVWVGKVPDERRSPHVEYPGEQPSAAPWLAHADVVALPSRADPFPLVVLEAMALGRPVVASDIEGPREQLGDAGTFVPVADAAALAEAVDALVADPAAAAVLGEAGRRRCAERWDVAPFGVTARRIRDAAAGPPAG